MLARYFVGNGSGVLLLYESNITSAYNLISKKGLAVTINRKTNSSYDVATGTMTVSTVSETGYAVVIKTAGHVMTEQ